MTGQSSVRDRWQVSEERHQSCFLTSTYSQVHLHMCMHTHACTHTLKIPVAFALSLFPRCKWSMTRLFPALPSHSSRSCPRRPFQSLCSSTSRCCYEKLQGTTLYRLGIKCGIRRARWDAWCELEASLENRVRSSLAWATE